MSCKADVWIVKRKGKRGTTYAVRWIDPATARWRSASCGRDRKHAENMRAIRKAELLAGIRGEIRRIPWAEFVVEHLGTIPGDSHRESTEHTLDEFASVCSPAGPWAVDYRMLEQYVTALRGGKKSVTDDTVNRKLRELKAALGKAKKRGYVRELPEFPMRQTETKLIRTLTTDEKRKLLDACPDHRWRTLLYVALTTGCRRGELLGLTWDRVDLDQRVIVLIRTKGKRDRTAPLTDHAAAMLRELRASTPPMVGPDGAQPKHPWVFASSIGTEWDRHNVSHGFQAIVKAAGIDHCTLHDLRRTFCTDLLEAGINEETCRELAGHASASTTARYYQSVSDSAKRAAVAQAGIEIA